MLKYNLIMKKNLKSSSCLKNSFKFETTAPIGFVLFSDMVYQIQINLNPKSQFA